MAKKIEDLSWQQVQHEALGLAKRVGNFMGYAKRVAVYGVPRGGVYVAQMLFAVSGFPMQLVDRPEDADIIVDDLIDSGATSRRYCQLYPDKHFFALFPNKLPDVWFTFPWERMANEQGPEDNIRRILEYVGEDPKREGLAETPQRVVRSWGELFAGYKQDPITVLKTFKEDSCDEMVILKDIEFYSTCEHHMVPFTGKAHIAYIPDGRVVGVSKLARLLEVYARRLQIQERICQQVTGTLMDVLKPKGAACVLEAKHLCMCARGVNKQNSTMVTSSLQGAFRESGDARVEFLRMIGR